MPDSFSETAEWTPAAIRHSHVNTISVEMT